MMRHLNPALIFLVVAGPIAGCGDNGSVTDPVDETGSSTVRVSGAIDREFSGLAVFGTGEDPETGEQRFALSLGVDQEENTTDDAVVGLVRTLGARPEEGTYVIGDVGEFDTESWAAENFGAVFIGSTTAIILSTSGSVTVTTSSEDQLEGSFSFSGAGVALDGDELNVTVEGDFDARTGTPDVSLPN